MGPTIDPAFIRYNRDLDDLEQQYIEWKVLEPRYYSTPELSPLAHREDFRTRYHPSKSNAQEAREEIAGLIDRVQPPYLAEKKAEEAKKAEEQAKADRLKGSDFDMDFI